MKKRHFLAIMILSIFLTSLASSTDNKNDFFTQPKLTKSIDFENSVILVAYEYHVITIAVSKGEAISGDWEATPADVISPAFLVFIVDSENLNNWKASSNLTQAVSRIPSKDLLYLYDPLLRVDDIPFDNRRSGVFHTKVPFSDNWSLILYAGPTAFPLTFSWHMSLVDARIADIVLYSLIGIVVVAAIAVFTIKVLRDRRMTYEEELEKVKQEEAGREEQIRLLEEVGEDY